MNKAFVTSEGQKRQVVEVFGRAFVRKLESTLVEDDGKYDLQRVLAQGNVLIAHMNSEMRKKMIELSEKKVGYLELVSEGENIVIGETTGLKHIMNSPDVFQYVNWLSKCNIHVVEKPTAARGIHIYRPFKNGTMADAFCGFGENLDRLCFTQGQIVSFAEEHSDKWIPKGKNGILFLSKISNEYVVFNVDWFGWSKNKLRIKAEPLRGTEYLLYHELEYRVAIPQFG